MSIRHIAEGQEFQFDRDFGFHGSAAPSRAEGRGGKPPYAGDAPTKGMGGPQRYADGGKIRGGSPPYDGDEPTRGPKNRPEPMEEGEGMPGDYAHGGHVHPHGGHVMREEHRAGGGKVCHMSHGGMTVHHPDGHVTHHTHDGSPVSMPEGGEYAHGGPMHMHPHGHQISHVEHRADGNVVHHHAHGGHTVHHTDGRVTHHTSDGTPAHMAAGGMEHMHDSSEVAHRARGGSAEEKGLIKKAFKQHENAEHGGKHEELRLARGGMPGDEVRLPRGMRPHAAQHHSPIGGGMPINTPPRNPNLTTTPRNVMSGGRMPYGVEPGSEPDMAGSEQGIPQMKRGGRAR